MLVLTRKPTETIRIGNDIVIKVIKTGSGAVKIGIEAPAEVRVMRGELVEATLPVPGVTATGPRMLREVPEQYPHVA